MLLEKDAKKGELIPFHFRNVEFYQSVPKDVQKQREEEWGDRIKVHFCHVLIKALKYVICKEIMSKPMASACYTNA